MYYGKLFHNFNTYSWVRVAYIEICLVIFGTYTLFVYNLLCVCVCIFLALRRNAGHDLLIHEVFKITHNDTPQSVGLLWTSEQLVAETST
jgi:hypothetical protein